MEKMSKQVFSDLIVIFKMMPSDMINKINPSFIKFVEDNYDEKYKSDIKPYIPIMEQKISEETQTMLGLIYQEYLMGNEEKKQLIQEKKDKIEKIRQDYKNDNLFKKGDSIKQKNNKLVPIKKQSFFQTIISKIKYYLKAKNK